MQSNCTFPGHFAPLTYYDLHCHEYVTTSCVPPKHTVSIIDVGLQFSIRHEFEDSFQKLIKLLDSAAITYAQHSTYWCTVYRPLVWFNFHAYWFIHVSAKCNPSFFVGWASCVFGMLELPARTLTYIYRPTTYTHIHTHTYTHTRTYTRTHTHTLTHTHTHTHTFTPIHTAPNCIVVISHLYRPM